MRSPPTESVIDANIILKTIFPEDYSLDVNKFVLCFGHDVKVYAPTFILLECANAFRNAIQRKGYPAGNAVPDLLTLQKLAINYETTESLLVPAMTLAARYGVSVYDALYAALAVRLGVPILTGDTRMINSLNASGIPFIPLSDVFNP